MDLLEEMKKGQIDIKAFIESQDMEGIQKRLMDQVSDEYDKNQGSFMYDTITPNTIEFALMYLALSQLIAVINPNTTYGEFLKGYASSLGVDKKMAECASGTLRICGTENTVIPRGTLFSTEIPNNQAISPKYYAAVKDVTIPTSGVIDVPVKAEKAGASQNVRANEIVVLCKTILGVSSVTNPESITNGTDDEDDEGLRKRFAERAQNPPSSGNKKDYERWAKEVSGVDDVIVEPLWSGPGTVKVTITFNGEAADQSVLDKVKQHLDPYPEGTGSGVAPIGAIVTVGTVTTLRMNIKIPNIKYRSGSDEDHVKTKIQTAISGYLKTIPLGGTIRIVKIEAAIGSIDEVIGFDDVLISLATADEYKNEDILLAAETKTSIGEVMYI